VAQGVAQPEIAWPVLEDAEKVDEVLVEVVEQFAAWGRALAQQHASGAGEGLRVVAVGREVLDDPGTELPLAAEVAEQRAMY